MGREDCVWNLHCRRQQKSFMDSLNESLTLSWADSSCNNSISTVLFSTRHLNSEGRQALWALLSHCKEPLTSSVFLWVTCRRRSVRNMREIHSCPRLPWSGNPFQICIKFHLIPSVSVVFFYLPAAEVLSTVPLTSQPISDVSKCLQGDGIR